MYVCRLCNFQFINKQEAREKGLYVLFPPASFRKANSQNGWKSSRRGVLCLSEFGMKQLAGLCAKKVLAAIMAVPNVGLEQGSVSIYFQLFSYSFFFWRNAYKNIYLVIMCKLCSIFSVLEGYVHPTVGYISRFLQLFWKVFYSEDTPKFWLTWIWNKDFAIICFMRGRLVNVWTLELTLWYLDCTYTSCGELACGVLMQTIKTKQRKN